MKSDLSIGNAIEDLRQARSRICDLVLLATAALAVPAASASVYRSVNIGWKWVMGAHIAAAAIIWMLYIIRKSVPFNIRAGSVVFIFLFIGLSGFWEFGMIAGANPMLLIAPVLATVLFGKRLGIAVAVAMVLMMILTAYSFVYGGRVFEIDFSVSDTYLPAWITYTLTVILAVSTSIVAISMSNSHLASALIKSRESQNALANLNRDLEHQVSERTMELQDAKAAAELQARTDVLTGLNNRRAFFELAEAIDAQSRRYNHAYVIAMIDVDHFKSVNDSWGHETGDDALVAVGRVISEGLRETDVLGRIGGEEFAVILPETVVEKGTSLAERLREAIEATVIQTSNGEIKVTVSIGIASLDDRNESLEMVVANADAALYLAKNAGRNRIELHQGSPRVSIGVAG